jgi:hypothetical protein
MTSTMAALDRAAERDPRSSDALPAFRQMAAASAVTLGRPS